MVPITDEDISRFAEKLPQIEDPILIVLKQHLLIEELLERLVSARLPQPEHLDAANITSFYTLMWIARACLPEKMDREEMWAAIKELNSVRNNLVHDLEPEDVEGEIQGLLEKWPPDADPSVEIPEDSSQIARLRLCFGHLYGAVLNTVTLVEDLNEETVD